jgi:hypothetical protein
LLHIERCTGAGGHRPQCERGRAVDDLGVKHRKEAWPARSSALVLNR